MRWVDRLPHGCAFAAALMLFAFYEQLSTTIVYALTIVALSGLGIQLLIELRAGNFDSLANLLTSSGVFGYFGPLVFIYDHDGNQMPAWLSFGSLALAAVGLLLWSALAVRRRRANSAK